MSPRFSSLKAAPLLLKGVPLLRLRLQRCNLIADGVLSAPRCPCCVAEPVWREEMVSTSAETSTGVLGVRDPPKYHRCDDPDYRKWKNKEEEILRDIEPIISLTKEILHSDRYMDGEQLTVADEEVVVKKLLCHHPRSEDKIGCGLDSIMVDRHPQFRHSRCLFVVRTDGGWINFSYQKCLRTYIRDKYPSHAERFIREHFKHGSS
ncbi:hypothetical protein PTKIN_Ptkin09bG0141700 [Pterospermum kingtungense]